MYLHARHCGSYEDALTRRAPCMAAARPTRAIPMTVPRSAVLNRTADHGAWSVAVSCVYTVVVPCRYSFKRIKRIMPRHDIPELRCLISKLGLVGSHLSLASSDYANFTPRTTARYDDPATRADRCNGPTHLPGIHHDDPQPKTRRPSLRPPSMRRAPSPLHLYQHIFILRFK